MSDAPPVIADELDDGSAQFRQRAPRIAAAAFGLLIGIANIFGSALLRNLQRLWNGPLAVTSEMPDFTRWCVEHQLLLLLGSIFLSVAMIAAAVFDRVTTRAVIFVAVLAALSLAQAIAVWPVVLEPVVVREGAPSTR